MVCKEKFSVCQMAKECVDFVIFRLCVTMREVPREHLHRESRRYVVAYLCVCLLSSEQIPLKSLRHQVSVKYCHGSKGIAKARGDIL